jgi:hypothetical protein
VIPETLTAWLSSCVGDAGSMCRKVALAPTMLRNVGFSENEDVSRGEAWDQNPPIGYVAVPSQYTPVVP